MQFAENKKVMLKGVRPASDVNDTGKRETSAGIKSEALILMEDVSFIRQQRVILDNINLEVNRGDFLAITGPNGGGKTTLLRLMLKLLKPTTGHITYLSKGCAGRRLSIGYLPQKNMIDSRFPITVREVVATGLISKSMSTPERRDKVESTIDLVGLTHRADFPIERLSGGQLQRALLGRAIIGNPELLVMDEPLSYVDKAMEHRIYDIIATLSPSTTIVLVSHEMSRIGEMATRHIIIDQELTECSTRHHYFFDGCHEAHPGCCTHPECKNQMK